MADSAVKTGVVKPSCASVVSADTTSRVVCLRPLQSKVRPMTQELYVPPSHILMHVKTAGLWLNPSPRKLIPTLLELIETMLESLNVRPTTSSLNEETCGSDYI